MIVPFWQFWPLNFKRSQFGDDIKPQLDWPSETDKLKKNLPRDQKGCDGFKTTYKKISTRRIKLCCNPSSIFNSQGYFWRITAQILIMERVSRHSFMRLVESSNTEDSGASEVPQSHGKLFFGKPSCCVFAQKPISIGVLSTSNN